MDLTLLIIREIAAISSNSSKTVSAQILFDARRIPSSVNEWYMFFTGRELPVIRCKWFGLDRVYIISIADALSQPHRSSSGPSSPFETQACANNSHSLPDFPCMLSPAKNLHATRALTTSTHLHPCTVSSPFSSTRPQGHVQTIGHANALMRTHSLTEIAGVCTFCTPLVFLLRSAPLPSPLQPRMHEDVQRVSRGDNDMAIPKKRKTNGEQRSRRRRKLLV
jgi:hypothetical protein